MTFRSTQMERSMSSTLNDKVATSGSMADFGAKDVATQREPTWGERAIEAGKQLTGRYRKVEVTMDVGGQFMVRARSCADTRSMSIRLYRPWKAASRTMPSAARTLD